MGFYLKRLCPLKHKLYKDVSLFIVLVILILHICSSAHVNKKQTFFSNLIWIGFGKKYKITSKQGSVRNSNSKVNYYRINWKLTEVEYLLQEIQLSIFKNDWPLSILLVSTIRFFFVRSVLDLAGSSSPCSRSWTGLALPTDRTRGLPRSRWRAAWTSSSIIAEPPSSRKIFCSPLLIASCNTTTMFSLQNYFVSFMHWLFETEIPWSLAKGWQHLLARSVFLMLLDMSIILRHAEIFCWGCRKLNLKTSTRSMERQTSAGLCYWPKVFIGCLFFFFFLTTSTLCSIIDF